MLHPPRKVPYLLKGKLKAKLERMERKEIIDKVDEPTDWVNFLVTAEKPTGKLRICLDPYDLNKAIKRDPMRNAESIMAEMADAKFFSKLDASSGYWQRKLDEENSKILTSNTPFGRYRFKRLPFGILSASEVFQKKITEILEGIEGCANVQDDIIVWGKTREEHNVCLSQVLERIDKSGLKLNKEKRVFGTAGITFLGHIFSDQGVKPDPKKIREIKNMPTPTNKSDLQRFLGMVTHLGKFIPDLSPKAKCLRQQLESSAEWQ